MRTFLKSNEKDLLLPSQCHACDEQFTPENLPYKIFSCLHSICGNCLEECGPENDRRCPVDKCSRKLNKDYELNFVLLSNLDVPPNLIATKCKIPNHSESEQNYICHVCNKLCCIRCIYQDHLTKHNNMKYSQIGSICDINEEKIYELNEIKNNGVDDIANKFTQINAKFATNLTKLRASDKKYQEIKTKLEDVKTNVQECIDDIGDKCNDRIENAYKAFEKTLMGHKTNIQKEISNADTLINRYVKRLEKLANASLREYVFIEDEFSDLSELPEFSPPATVVIPQFSVRLEGLTELMKKAFPSLGDDMN